MRKFGLIGYPLGHSFSRNYFAEKFKKESLSDCIYDNYETDNLDSVIDLIKNDNEFVGLNVTIPYKSEIIKYLDSIDPEAAVIDAVNVLKISFINKTSHLKGYNTDIYGFRESLLPFLATRKVNKALILGTGGGSKAVAHVLTELGIKFEFVSRRNEAGILTYHNLTREIIGDNHLIVNTTPLGMYPDIHNKPEIDYTFITQSHILYDLIYNPELTAFLREGKQRGCIIIGGLKMLQLQADKSWEIWNNDSY